MSRTRLDITLPDLPDEFPGLTAKELVRFIANGLRVYVPFELGQVQIGGAEPTTSNVLWFEDGVTPKVWDPNTNRFGPINVEESFKRVVWLGVLPPPSSNPAQLWLRTFQDAEPRFELYRKRDDEWVPAALTPAVGPTESRPTDPAPFQQYFDTSINGLIHWERGAWRTVAGMPGDVKFVLAGSEEEAVAQNPGWVPVPSDLAGRVLGVAGQGSGLTRRAPGEVVGEESTILTEQQIPKHRHFLTEEFRQVGAATQSEPTKDGTIVTTRDVGTPGSYRLGRRANSTQIEPDTFVSSYVGGNQGHPNMQPSAFLIALTKQ